MDEIHVEKKHASTMRVCFLFCKRDYRNSTFTYMSIKIKVKLWVGLLVCCCCSLFERDRRYVTKRWPCDGANIAMLSRERTSLSETIKSANCSCERKLKAGLTAKTTQKIMRIIDQLFLSPERLLLTFFALSGLLLKNNNWFWSFKDIS